METTTTDRAKGIAIARAMKPGGLGIRIPQRDKLRNPRWTLVSCVRGGGRPTGGKLFVENL